MELKELNSGKSCPKKSPLTKLSPFLDGKGVLRVGGRLENSGCDYGQMHPVILPDVSKLSLKIMQAAHFKTLHGGCRLMMSVVRQNFWVINLRNLCKNIVSRCVTCVRHRAEASKQLMGSFPSVRVRMSHTFEKTGVDYAGPFQVTVGEGKLQHTINVFVAAFVCMATKAVDFRLVEGLSTDAFLAAFTRFNSTRGPCLEVWSDNGRNFVGAERILSSLIQSWMEGGENEKELRKLEVKWNFIAPYAPHQGGLWEAVVKSMKHHLKRVTGALVLSKDEMETVLCQIGAILNSRPLGVVRDDPGDLVMLTPAHFLNGRPMVQLFGAYSDEKIESRTLGERYRAVQRIAQQFWKVWRADYLNELQQRPKWQLAVKNISIGDLVLLKDDNAMPAVWKRGRVTQVYPDGCGRVRNVLVDTSGREMRRAIQSLVVLPVED